MRRDHEQLCLKLECHVMYAILEIGRAPFFKPCPFGRCQISLPPALGGALDEEALDQISGGKNSCHVGRDINTGGRNLNVSGTGDGQSCSLDSSHHDGNVDFGTHSINVTGYS